MCIPLNVYTTSIEINDIVSSNKWSGDETLREIDSLVLYKIRTVFTGISRLKFGVNRSKNESGIFLMTQGSTLSMFLGWDENLRKFSNEENRASDKIVRIQKS